MVKSYVKSEIYKNVVIYICNTSIYKNQEYTLTLCNYNLNNSFGLFVYMYTANNIGNNRRIIFIIRVLILLMII